MPVAVTDRVKLPPLGTFVSGCGWIVIFGATSPAPLLLEEELLELLLELLDELEDPEELLLELEAPELELELVLPDEELEDELELLDEPVEPVVSSIVETLKAGSVITQLAISAGTVPTNAGEVAVPSTR